MDWFDRKIVQYVLLWGPYDAMHDEDTYPEFGMGVRLLNERFTRIIAQYGDAIGRLDEADRDLLARARLQQSRSATPRTRSSGDPGARDRTARPPGDHQRAHDPVADTTTEGGALDGRPPARRWDRPAAKSATARVGPRQRPQGVTHSDRAIQMARVAARAAASIPAYDVVIVDVSAQSAIADCIVIGATSNDRFQVGAIVDHVDEKMREAGYPPAGRETAWEVGWAMLDYVDILVQIHHQKEPHAYELAGIWHDCPIIPVDVLDWIR